MAENQLWDIKLLNTNEVEMEMVTLTDDEKKYVDLLENKIADGAGAVVSCSCRV